MHNIFIFKNCREAGRMSLWAIPTGKRPDSGFQISQESSRMSLLARGGKKGSASRAGIKRGKLVSELQQPPGAAPDGILSRDKCSGHPGKPRWPWRPLRYAWEKLPIFPRLNKNPLSMLSLAQDQELWTSPPRWARRCWQLPNQMSMLWHRPWISTRIWTSPALTHHHHVWL